MSRKDIFENSFFPLDSSRITLKDVIKTLIKKSHFTKHSQKENWAPNTPTQFHFPLTRLT